MPDMLQVRPENAPNIGILVKSINSASSACNHDDVRMLAAQLAMQLDRLPAHRLRARREWLAAANELAGRAVRLASQAPAMHEVLVGLGLSTFEIGAWWSGSVAELRRDLARVLRKGPGTWVQAQRGTGSDLLASLFAWDGSAQLSEGA